MLNEWQSHFKGKINFLLVYIAEAHAKDVWPLGNHVVIESHKCIQDRQTAAQQFISRGCHIPIVLDSMDDEFDKAYAVWPERFFLAHKNRLVEVFFPTIEFGFDMENIKKSLEEVLVPKEIVVMPPVSDSKVVVVPPVSESN